MIPVVIQTSNINESMKNRSFCKIRNRTAIEFLIERIQKEYCNQCYLITSNAAVDDIYVDIAHKMNVQIFRGKFGDILGRLKSFIDFSGAENFIRVFGNRPLLDIEAMKKLVHAHLSGKYQYSYNEHEYGMIWGTGCEVFRSNLIDSLIQEQLTQSQQETLEFYLRQNVNKYNVFCYMEGKKRKNYKVNLESQKDYEVIKELTDNLQNINNRIISDYFEKHYVLAKYNQDEPSKEVGIDKILLHPDKIKNILQNGEDDNSYPISVELTLTNVCNLRCVYCSDLELRQKQGGKTHIEKEVLFKLFDDLSVGGTTGITIEGGGEPTLYPYFNEVVQYATEKGLAVGLITNGVRKIDLDIVKKFEWIRVSLDASTEEEYQNLKGINYFEQVLDNIEYFSQNCKTVGVGYVVTNQNLSQIEALVMRLREVGASYIQLRPVVDNQQLYPVGVDLSFLKIFQTQNFAVIIDGMKENAESGNHHLSCVANGITSIISGDGSVYLCGRLNIYDWLEPIGNIKERPFKDIWCGDIRRKQRNMVMDDVFCSKNCPQCRVTKFNELFNRLNQISSKHFI